MIRPIILDVSKWQGKMNWEAAFSAGARAAILRAGSIDNETGQCYKDIQFENNKGAAARFMPVAYYWYFRANHDPIKQADFFSGLVSGLPFFRLFADIEEHGGVPAGRLADNLALFVERLRKNFGGKVGIYTRASFWNSHVARRELWPSLDLWVARYINQAGPWSDDAKFKPRDWEDWKIWQYSADGNFRGAEFGADSAHIDINYFNGDFRALSKYCGAQVSPLAEPLSIPEPVAPKAPLGVCKVIAPVLNLRSNASVHSNDRGDLLTGTQLYWFKQVRDDSGNQWLQVGPSVYISEVFRGERLVLRE